MHVVVQFVLVPLYSLESIFVFFFFQAEDGIRVLIVTGVQTCAFFFSSRRRHTRSDRDSSSDVCSSDLRGGQDAGDEGQQGERERQCPVGAPHQLERAPAVTEYAEETPQRRGLAAAARGAGVVRRMNRCGNQERMMWGRL